MSKRLLDVHPVSFRVYFSGSSRYFNNDQSAVVTTVLDHVLYNTTFKRKHILNKLKSDLRTAAVEDEIRAVCRELLASPDCPQAVHQRLTTILVFRNSDDSAPTPSGCHLPQSCTLVVAINPEGTADRLWGSVASQLHQFSATMVSPRRSRRLTIMPEPAPAASSSRARPAGRGSRLKSPARRPVSPGAAPKPAAGRGRPAAASSPASSARLRTTGIATAAAAARRTAAARKKAASPTASTESTGTSRRSIAVRSRRSSVAVSPPPSAASRRQTFVRRSKAASPPAAQRLRKSSMSPTKERVAARANRKIRSPSFAREIRVRTGVDNEMTDFNLPDGLTGSKKLMLHDLMANPTVVLETPGLLKRFSKKLTESSPPTKPAAKSTDRSAKSASKPLPDAKVKKRRDSPSVSPVRVGGEQAISRSKKASPAAASTDSSVKPAAKRGRPPKVQKRARAESRSPSATPPKKTRVASGDSAKSALRVAAPVTTDTDSPPPEALSQKRPRPSLGSVRKSLNASLTAAPKAAASPASPVLRIHTPAATPASTAAVTSTRTISKVLRSVAESSEVSVGVAESSEVTVVVAESPRRPTAALPPQLVSPERAAGVQALLAARSSIRRRPAGQPPPPADTLSASPTLKPAREAAASALNRAYVSLARSEAKQKDLFRSLVTGVAVAASPALAKPAGKSSVTRTVDETTAVATSKKSAVESNTNQVVAQKSPVEPASDQPPTEAAPEKTGWSDAVDSADAVFASPAGRGTPRGQLAPRSSVRRAPASALRRVLDRAPDSAARSSVRRVLRRPFPPPEGSLGQDTAAGGDSPLMEASVTRSRRVKLASELHSPIEGSTELNNVKSAGMEQLLPGVTQLSYEDKVETEAPQRRSVICSACLMLLLLIVVVLGVLWLARGQLPPQQQQQLQQLQRSVEQQSQQLAQQLEQLVRQQTERVRGWMAARQPAIPPAPIPTGDQL